MLSASNRDGEIPERYWRRANEELGHLLLPGEEVVSLSPVDLDEKGHYAEGWLFLTDQRLLLGFVGAKTSNKEVNLGSISNVRIESGVGNGAVFIDIDDRSILFCRYTRTQATFVEQVVAPIKQHIQERTPTNGQMVTDEKSQERQGAGRHGRREIRCAKCNRVKRGSVCPYCVEKSAMFRRLIPYIKPYLPQLIFSIVLLLIAAVFTLIPPTLTGILVDDVLIDRDYDRLRFLVILLGGVYLGGAAVEGLRGFIMGRVGQSVVRDLRSEVFHHLQKLGMDYYDNVRTGAVMSRATNDTERLQRFIIESTQGLIMHIVMILGVGVVLFRVNWKLALFTLIPIPIILYATRVFSVRMRRVYRRISVRRALMNSVLADSISGIKVVKSFAQEDREIGKFDRRNDQVFHGRIAATRGWSMFNPFLSVATSIGVLVIWRYGGSLVIREGSMSAGDLVSFLYYVNMFYNPIRQLSGFADVVQEAATASERVFEILDTEPESDRVDATSRPVDVPFEGAIEFHNVSFAYHASEPVLRNINVKIRPGEMIGLVGPSGSGKTTMANLIPRLYDVNEGAITIDGQDIRTFDLATLRGQIGVVLQDPLLFHGTIADNIAYGVPNASREEIIWAAQAANAHDFIMQFTDGYDTHTGERGLRLSGGQKQRISIARAILKNPRILILDEATSSVDTETEKLIQEAIERLTDNRTTIAIAHRLSTLQNADRLLVLENGQIVEEGTHAELMARDGVFARLVKMQSAVAESQVVL